MNNNRQQVTQVVYDVITEILPGLSTDQIITDRHLADLGADSVDRVEIIVEVTSRLGIDQPLSNFGHLRDIRSLIECLTALAD